MNLTAGKQLVPSPADIFAISSDGLLFLSLLLSITADKSKSLAPTLDKFKKRFPRNNHLFGVISYPSFCQ